MAECVFHGEDCRGRLQWHHVVSRSRLRKAWRSAKAAHRRGGPKPWSITKAIADERNRAWVCAYHHGEVEAHRLYVTPGAGVVLFAKEYGLDRDLEADRERAGQYKADRERAA